MCKQEYTVLTSKTTSVYKKKIHGTKNFKGEKVGEINGNIGYYRQQLVTMNLENISRCAFVPVGEK